jgi:ribosomal protein S18 acetylase RimI-like enzyme
LSPIQNTGELVIDPTSTISDQVPESNQIVQIAESSFKVSQFLNDPYLPREKARGIYGDIVKNAFGKRGRFFVVTKKSGSVAGFLLFSMDKAISSSTIQLIAVSQDFMRQGIGQALIRSMENYVCSQGILTVVVGTQFNNFSALKTYHSNGYNDFDCSSIYHYWPMKR